MARFADDLQRFDLQKLFSSGLIWSADPAGSDPALDSAPLRRHEPARVPFGVPEIDSALAGGLRRGETHEFTSPDLPPLTVLSVLARNALEGSRRYVFWIGKRCRPTPHLLDALGLLSSSIFLEPPSEKLLLWSIDSALRSPAVAAVVAECRSLPLTLSKRFAMAAGTHGAIGLLAFRSSGAQRPAKQSAAASQWSVTHLLSPSSAPRWELELSSIKGSSPRQRIWSIEFSPKYDPHVRETVPLHISSGMGGGSELPRTDGARTGGAREDGGLGAALHPARRTG